MTEDRDRYRGKGEAMNDNEATALVSARDFRDRAKTTIAEIDAGDRVFAGPTGAVRDITAEYRADLVAGLAQAEAHIRFLERRRSPAG
jgi:hypothetical protein